MKTKFEFDKVVARMQQMKSDLPVKLANQAQNFFSDSFNKSGFTDGGLQSWKEVKRRIPGTPEYKYPKTKQLSRRSSLILVRTGKLKRAVGNSIRQANFNLIRLTVPLKYAAFHNEGTEKIQRRKYMGDSRTLRSNQKVLINKVIVKAWRG